MKKIFFLFIVLFSGFHGFSQYWNLSGNAAASTDVLGTTANYDLKFISQGYSAGSVGTTNNNTSLGVSTLSNNTTGSGNTAQGILALYSNTSGSENTATGKRALTNNTTANSNTANGAWALYLDSTGSGNTATGALALYNNITGNENTATGKNALGGNTTASSNTANGAFSLYSSSTGGSNTANGASALYSNTTGAENTALGKSASNNITTGSDNTVVGYNTGLGITTGSYNTIIGANVTGLTSSLSGTVILADGLGNQRVYIDSSGNVGIGNTAPAHKLDVNGNIYTNGKILLGSTLTKAGSFSMAVNGDAIFNRVVIRLYSSWPDYVFNKQYHLEKLENVEKYIKTHNHLKGFQPATINSRDGVDVNETQRLLTEKVEELTLYLIEQNKQIAELRKEVKALKSGTSKK